MNMFSRRRKMTKISAIEIRNKFLNFFKEKDHMEIENSSVIPKNDPTLLFINSGMAPIKNYFTGVQKPPYARLCDVQPCIRTIDIDSIGDKHHLTSFQMLGSWSINDYFKEKAISLAFEFLTKHLNIPQEKLYVTVFAGDESLGLPYDKEAYEFWKKVGMPENHIVQCGKEDNFWGPTAETGPCGPCTEIFYDTGEGEEYIPGGIFDTKKRYIEIWNAGVFMQLNKNADGTFSRLSFTSVDTGAGLERLAMVLNGYSTVYDTDLLNPIKKAIESEVSESFKIDEKDILIMTDHLRTATLILSEKVSPSNEGRGYIPRKLIRRCMMIIAKNKLINFEFSKIVGFIIENYSNMFPKFNENKEYIISEFEKEYKQFQKVLENGLEKLESIKNKSENITSDQIFELVTTYGLPFDIIKNYADENGLSIDEAGFETKLQSHKEKSKNLSATDVNGNMKEISAILCDRQPTSFVGYEELSCGVTITDIVRENELVNSACEGEKIAFVLDKTPFYAESGGQCADSGAVCGENFKVSVTDVKKTSSGVFVHFGTVEHGEVKTDYKALAEINKIKRNNTKNNHTAVHLLQSALQKKFGKEVHQAGSKVDDMRLRFDFNYDKPISDQEIFEIEKLVNSYIRENISRKTEIKKLSEAISSGAIAIFESKYGDDVRVVTYGNVSSELCGGTHTEMTGNIGLFTIVGVEGIGKGIKRITAVTGEQALSLVQHKTENINKLSKKLKVKPENLFEKLEKEFAQKNSNQPASKPIADLKLNYIKDDENLKIAYVRAESSDKKIVSQISKMANKINGVVFGVIGTEKLQVIVSVSDKCVEKIAANEILLNIFEQIGGKGGGNRSVASGGTGANIDDVIKAVHELEI